MKPHMQGLTKGRSLILRRGCLLTSAKRAAEFEFRTKSYVQLSGSRYPIVLSVLCGGWPSRSDTI